MRSVVLTIALLLSGFALAAEVTARLSADTAAAGEVVALELSSSDGAPVLRNPPALENGSWVGGGRQSQEMSTIGNRTSSRYSTQYEIQAGKEGTLVIPPLSVEVGSKTETTPELRLRVVAAAERSVNGARRGESVALGDAVFGRIRLPDKRKSFYLGEEIPVEFELFIRDGFGLRVLSYPEPEFGKVIFRDYRAVNQEDGRFAPPQQSADIVDGKRFMKLVFRTSFRALAAGELTPAGKIRIGIPERRGRRASPFDEDDFFSGFFGGQGQFRQQEIEFAAAGAITVKALPPPPAGVIVPGLVGDWKIRYQFDDKTAPKVGEVLNFKIILSGSGSGETLTAPKLDLPGFRVYPAETDKTGIGGGIVLNYSLIPLRPGKSKLELALATFNPGSGAYNISRFERDLEVAPSDRPLDAVVAGRAEPEPEAKAAAEEKKAPPSTLFYLKAPCGSGCASELGNYDTRLFWWLLAAGPLLFAVIEILIRRRLRAAANPAVLRLAAAKKRRTAVLAALKAARNSAELGDAVHREVAPLLCDALDLPPGMTAEEVSSKLDDAELVRAMRSSGDDAYRPGGESLELETARTALIKGIKKLFTLAIVVAACGWLGAAEPAPASAEADLKTAATAYDAGDFARACKIYDACLLADEIDPAAYYNFGCANYMARNYPEAIVRFEQARRLHPTDSAALENLNLARHQLGLPETGRVNSPVELGIYLRDRLRPEQWLALAGAAWVLAFAALAFRRKLGPIRSRILTGTLFALFLLGVALAWSELATSYHPGRAFALSGGAPLKSLPGPTGRLQGEVPAGHEISIVERRSNYSLVRYGNLQGWVENRFIRPVFR